MLQITIPGQPPLHLEHLLLDYNGTLATDGNLLPGVAERLERLANDLQIHIITADTFASAAEELAALPAQLTRIPHSAQDQAKRQYAEQLGCHRLVAIGNGYNDQRMLAAAELGIAVAQTEAVAIKTLLAADLLIADICAALDLLLNPQRLIATLRN